MADYFLKNADASRMYRIEYATDESSHVTVGGMWACATGFADELPDGTVIAEMEQPVQHGQVLVDLVLNGLVEGTLAEYRTLAKAMVDAMWAV
jgi:hypothetical protein